LLSGNNLILGRKNDRIELFLKLLFKELA